MCHDTTQKVKAVTLLSLVDIQVFARKILRLFGNVRKEDIENEARAVSKICEGGKCKNIVEVISHGWLPNHNSFYYIDMEFCLETLDDRIFGTVREDAATRYVEAESDAAAPYVDHQSAAGNVKPQMTEFVQDAKLGLFPDFEEADLQYCLDIVDDIVTAS